VDPKLFFSEQDAALRSGLKAGGTDADQVATVFSKVRDSLPADAGETYPVCHRHAQALHTSGLENEVILRRASAIVAGRTAVDNVGQLPLPVDKPPPPCLTILPARGARTRRHQHGAACHGTHLLQIPRTTGPRRSRRTPTIPAGRPW